MCAEDTHKWHAGAAVDHLVARVSQLKTHAAPCQPAALALPSSLYLKLFVLNIDSMSHSSTNTLKEFPAFLSNQHVYQPRLGAPVSAEPTSLTNLLLGTDGHEIIPLLPEISTPHNQVGVSGDARKIMAECRKCAVAAGCVLRIQDDKRPFKTSGYIEIGNTLHLFQAQLYRSEKGDTSATEYVIEFKELDATQRSFGFANFRNVFLQFCEKMGESCEPVTTESFVGQWTHQSVPLPPPLAAAGKGQEGKEEEDEELKWHFLHQIIREDKIDTKIQGLLLILDFISSAKQKKSRVNLHEMEKNLKLMSWLGGSRSPLWVACDDDDLGFGKLNSACELVSGKLNSAHKRVQNLAVILLHEILEHKSEFTAEDLMPICSMLEKIHAVGFLSTHHEHGTQVTARKCAKLIQTSSKELGKAQELCSKMLELPFPSSPFERPLDIEQ